MIKTEWVELVEIILFDDSIKGDKAKKSITDLSAELLIAVAPLIAQTERERLIKELKENSWLSFGGCNARIRVMWDSYWQSLVSREAHND